MISRQAAKAQRVSSRSLILEAVDQACDPVLHPRRAEIEQEAHPEIRESEIRQGLLLVDRRAPLNGLELDENAALHNEVGAKPRLDAQVLVHHVDRDLPRNAEAPAPELECEHDFVDRLEQPRTERLVNTHRRVDHDARDAVLRELRVAALGVLAPLREIFMFGLRLAPTHPTQTSRVSSN
jgi:hypothetical protein